MAKKRFSKRQKNLVGAWSFLIGVVLAVIIGLFISVNQFYLSNATYQIVFSMLVILGLAIGFLNVKIEESRGFLLAAIALVLVSYMGRSALTIIPVVRNILSVLMVLFIPTTVIVALKTVFEYSKD